MHFLKLIFHLFKITKQHQKTTQTMRAPTIPMKGIWDHKKMQYPWKWESSQDDSFIKEFLTHKPDLSDCSFHVMCEESSGFPDNTIPFAHL